MIYQSPLGVLNIEAIENAITSIRFTDEPVLEGKKINSIRENDLLNIVARQLDEYFSGKRFQFDFPIRQEGTQFQQRVWNELLKISYGNTISYHRLSVMLGDTKAIRAAASANGKNNLPIVVPCHRVIGTDGSLTGYGGGLWRKQWLLDHENKYGNGVQKLF